MGNLSTISNNFSEVVEVFLLAFKKIRLDGYVEQKMLEAI